MMLFKKLILCLLVTSPVIASPSHTAKWEKLAINSLNLSQVANYSTIAVSDRTIALLEKCNIKKVEGKPNEFRLQQASLKVTCHDNTEISFSAKLGGKTKSLVAKRDLKRNTKLCSNDTAVEWVDIKLLKSIPIKVLIDDGRYAINKNTLAGEPIYKKNLTTAPAIKRGWHAYVIARTSNVTIKIGVEALEDGNVGDRIKVRNTESQNTFFAEVIDKNTLKIK